MVAGPMLTSSSPTGVRIRLAMHLLLLPALDRQTGEPTGRQDLLLLALGQPPIAPVATTKRCGRVPERLNRRGGPTVHRTLSDWPATHVARAHRSERISANNVSIDLVSVGNLDLNTSALSYAATVSIASSMTFSNAPRKSVGDGQSATRCAVGRELHWRRVRYNLAAHDSEIMSN